MNTNSQKRAHRTPIYRRPAVILTFLGILVVVATVVIVVFMNLDRSAPGNDVNSSPEPTSGSSTPDASSVDTTDDIGWESKTPSYEGENANQYHELTGTIIRKDVDSATQTLTIYAMIDQYFNTPGACTILLKKSGNVVYRTEVTAEADITTSVCEPIEISTNQISSGTYEIEIQLSGNNKTGIIKEEVNL